MRVKRKHAFSRLLTIGENYNVVDLLGRNCQSEAMALVKFFRIDGCGEGEVNGVLTLVFDLSTKSYSVRLYCLRRRQLLWKHQINDGLQYKIQYPFLHYIEAKVCNVGFHFHDLHDAGKFKNTLIKIIKGEREKLLAASNEESNSAYDGSENETLIIMPPVNQEKNTEETIISLLTSSSEDDNSEDDVLIITPPVDQKNNAKQTSVAKKTPQLFSVASNKESSSEDDSSGDSFGSYCSGDDSSGDDSPGDDTYNIPSMSSVNQKKNVEETSGGKKTPQLFSVASNKEIDQKNNAKQTSGGKKTPQLFSVASNKESSSEDDSSGDSFGSYCSGDDSPGDDSPGDDSPGDDTYNIPSMSSVNQKKNVEETSGGKRRRFNF